MNEEESERERKRVWCVVVSLDIVFSQRIAIKIMSLFLLLLSTAAYVSVWAVAVCCLDTWPHSSLSYKYYETTPCFVVYF